MWPLLFLGLLAPSGGGPGPAPSTPPVLVSAAVSLTEALSECGAAFTAATGIPLQLNFGASNVLARQIVRGAPVDVFVSADEAQMEYAAGAGAIEPDSLVVIASNELVIVVTGRDAPRWSSPMRLLDPSIKSLAIGDPAAVPAGVYARQWLERIGLWDRVQPRLVPAASVRGALSAVSSGAADAGIVYRTDVPSVSGTRVVLSVTGEAAPIILYPAAMVRHSRNAATARRFLAFLRGAAAQRILAQRGFGPPPHAGTR